MATEMTFQRPFGQVRVVQHGRDSQRQDQDDEEQPFEEPFHWLKNNVS
jgi:hypothetical protein